MDAREYFSRPWTPALFLEEGMAGELGVSGREAAREALKLLRHGRLKVPRHSCPVPSPNRAQEAVFRFCRQDPHPFLNLAHREAGWLYGTDGSTLFRMKDEGPDGAYAMEGGGLARKGESAMRLSALVPKRTCTIPVFQGEDESWLLGFLRQAALMSRWLQSVADCPVAVDLEVEGHALGVYDPARMFRGLRALFSGRGKAFLLACPHCGAKAPMFSTSTASALFMPVRLENCPVLKGRLLGGRMY